jgi:hypothetical protein
MGIQTNDILFDIVQYIVSSSSSLLVTHLHVRHIDEPLYQRLLPPGTSHVVHIVRLCYQPGGGECQNLRLAAILDKVGRGSRRALVGVASHCKAYKVVLKRARSRRIERDTVDDLRVVTVVERLRNVFGMVFRRDGEQVVVGDVVQGKTEVALRAREGRV